MCLALYMRGPVLLSHAALSRLHNSQLFIQLSHSGAVATVTRMQCVYDTSRMHSSGTFVPFGHAPCGPYICGKSTPCRQTYNSFHQNSHCQPRFLSGGTEVLTQTLVQQGLT